MLSASHRLGYPVPRAAVVMLAFSVSMLSGFWSSIHATHSDGCRGILRLEIIKLSRWDQFWLPRRRKHPRTSRRKNRSRSKRALSRCRGGGTKGICDMRQASLASYAGVAQHTLIICALLSHGPWAGRSVMNTRCRFAPCITGNCTTQATRRSGGSARRSILFLLPTICGGNLGTPRGRNNR